MKKLLSFLLAFMLLASTAGAIDLYVDTELIQSDTPPMVVDGRTLVPVRAIFEAIGAAVAWDEATSTATGIRDGFVVNIQINNTTAYVNGEPRVLDVPAQLINGRTMVPARFISEAMGCDVTWYEATGTAAVADEMKGRHIYVTKSGKHYHFDGSCNGGTYYEATLAEAMGRGLTPCDKCVLTNGEAQPSTAPGTIPDAGPETAEKYVTTVLRVVDGDTIVVNYNSVEEYVRLIGVDTPESVHPDSSRNTEEGILASDYTKSKLEGKQVELEFDVQQRDMYGRLLAYVYVDGVMFNKTLLEDGVANLATYPPNVKYVDAFTAIVAARNAEQSPAQPVEPGTTPDDVSGGNRTPPANPGNADNFNTYDNPDQQETSSQWVLNTKSMKIHYPTCREVKKIAPQNYSTSNLPESELKAQGYTTCGVCHK